MSTPVKFFQRFYVWQRFSLFLPDKRSICHSILFSVTKKNILPSFRAEKSGDRRLSVPAACVPARSKRCCPFHTDADACRLTPLVARSTSREQILSSTSLRIRRRKSLAPPCLPCALLLPAAPVLAAPHRRVMPFSAKGSLDSPSIRAAMLTKSCSVNWLKTTISSTLPKNSENSATALPGRGQYRNALVEAQRGGTLLAAELGHDDNGAFKETILPVHR